MEVKAAKHTKVLCACRREFSAVSVQSSASGLIAESYLV
jgi:hypothetical protein